MKKTIVFFALSILTISSLFAQSPTSPQATVSKKQVTISGKIVDAKTNELLEYATVILKDVKTKKISGGITDEKGNFNIQTPTGTYDISFEFISFKTITISNRLINKSMSFGTIKLKEDSERMDEISIIAEKSTVEIRLDKRIYHVGKDMTVKGGTASDVLDNVPSVSVDVEGNVSLRGSENVRILIDGKPSALVGLSGTDALRQLPADAIERVEVITSPSARYGAEGTAGILNIILRKGKITGLNGSVNATVGDPEQYRFSTNLNLRGKKVNLFTNFGYNYRTGPGKSLTDLSSFSNGILQSSRIEDREFQRENKGFNGNLGLEVYLTKESSIVGSIFLRDSDNGSTSTNNINVFDANGATTLSDVRIQNEVSDNK
ncbi:MAG: carboxypeptidase-like regulatory domain-containing protein, partial [Flavobacteriaceae bacterium]|nr:carboxypeptidase-like regulatory domain-containing protein [Flavobacteriaceae bacterium]